MSEHDRLLAAIVADPDAAEPRRAFADWLDGPDASPADRGRAEAIRLGVQSTRTDGFAADREAASARLAELAGEFADEWARDLPALDGIVWGSEWVGGFVDEVRADDWAAALRHADTILATAPCPLLELPFDPAGLAALAGTPELTRFRRLAIRATEPPADASALRELLDSPGICRLRALVLCGLGDAGARAVAASAGLPAGLVLDMSASGVTNAGASALARWPGLVRIRRLDLSNNRILNSGLDELLRSPHLRGILCVAGNLFGATCAGTIACRFPPVDASLASLARASAENGLLDEARLALADRLEADGDGIRSEYLRVLVELARQPDPDRRAFLEDRRRDLADEALRSWVAVLPVLDGVTWRGLAPTGVPGIVEVRDWATAERHAAAIAAAAPFPVLRLALTRADAPRMAASAALACFRGLSLSVTGGADAGPLAVLLASSHLAGLRLLELEGFGDAGATVFAESRFAGQLGRLHLDRQGLSDTGARELARWLAAGAGRVGVVSVRDNNLTDAGVLAILSTRHRPERVEAAGNPVTPAVAAIGRRYFGDTEFDALVGDVFVSPLATGPRQALSDWLRRHGRGGQAESVLPPKDGWWLPPDDPRMQSYWRRRWDDLAGEAERLWLPLLPTLPGLTWAGFWPYGLPGMVRARDWPTAERHAGALTLSAPLPLLAVALSAEDAARMADAPEAARFWGLQLSAADGADLRRGLRRLLNAPSLGRLRWLLLEGLGDAGCEALAAAGGGPEGLEVLQLHGLGVTDAGARALAAWPGLGRLRECDLSGNASGDAGGRQLLDSAYRPAWLGLEGNPLSGAARAAWRERYPVPTGGVR